MKTAHEVRERLRSLADPEKAPVLQRFFKTGPGEYAAGDRFLGIVVPASRKVMREARALPLVEIKKLLHSQFHEERFVAILLLVDRYKRLEADRRRIFDLYLASTTWINNWDLVDASAEHIVGPQTIAQGVDTLERLARSASPWERRIAMLATFHDIRLKRYERTLHIATLLLDDPHDLIHKAAGWMLREIGNRDLTTEMTYLDKYARRMPRTMLRYAIEKFPEVTRQKYLRGAAI